MVRYQGCVSSRRRSSPPSLVISSRCATVATRRMVSARLRSTPRRCHVADVTVRRRDAGGAIRRSAGPGAGSPNAAHETRPCASRLPSCHLLFEDGRDERVEDPLGAAQPHPRHATGEACDGRVSCGLEAFERVERAAHPGCSVEEPACPGPPASRHDRSSGRLHREMDRAGTVGCPCRPPDPVDRVADGRVGATVADECQRAPQVGAMVELDPCAATPCIEAAGRRCR